MSNSRKWKLVIVISLVAMIGVGAFAWANGDVTGREKDYKKLMDDMNSSLESVRSGEDPSDSLSSAQKKYGSVFDNTVDNFLRNEISSSFDSLIDKGKLVEKNQVLSLRKNISRAGDQTGLSLPLTYGFSSLIIVVMSALGGLVATALSKVFIDWGVVEDAKLRMEDIKEDIEELRRSKGKNTRKLDLKSEEMNKARGKLWETSVKQASLYLALLLLLVPFFKFIYGDWTVIWLPFNWLSTGGFQSLVGVSMEYMGWHVLTFLGFSFLWRELFLSKEEKMIQ